MASFHPAGRLRQLTRSLRLQKGVCATHVAERERALILGFDMLVPNRWTRSHFSLLFARSLRRLQFLSYPRNSATAPTPNSRGHSLIQGQGFRLSGTIYTTLRGGTRVVAPRGTDAQRSCAWRLLLNSHGIQEQITNLSIIAGDPSLSRQPHQPETITWWGALFRLDVLKQGSSRIRCALSLLRGG